MLISNPHRNQLQASDTIILENRQPFAVKYSPGRLLADFLVVASEIFRVRTTPLFAGKP